MIEQEQKPRKRIRELSPEELRAYKRASMKKHRDAKRAEDEAVKATEATRHIDDVHEFWRVNRENLPADKLAEMTTLHERSLDELYWMKHGQNVDSSDPDYVSLAEGVADLVEFVRNHPSPHLGAWLASELPLDWGSQKFWANPQMMESIASEGHATEVYAKYGYLTGVPDWRVYFFLIEELPKLGRKKWSHDDVAKLLGMVTGGDGVVHYPKASASKIKKMGAPQ
jgi:hypothetical protein